MTRPRKFGRPRELPFSDGIRVRVWLTLGVYICNQFLPRTLCTITANSKHLFLHASRCTPAPRFNPTLSSSELSSFAFLRNSFPTLSDCALCRTRLLRPRLNSSILLHAFTTPMYVRNFICSQLQV